MSSLANRKRKVDYNANSTPAQARKKQKGRDARTIATQTADAALSTSGELNIASFVRAREFEIAALDQSMKKARKGLNSRAFQQVPRHMRRRTASHNVKKIPKRLRNRAAREILEDNTPTGSARKRKLSGKLRLRLETAKRLQKLNANRKKSRAQKKAAKHNIEEPDPEKHISLARVPRIKKNKLANPPQATSKFKRRQVNKTWLPTHLWHTKRAHITPPTLPLWRMAIPLRPTEKTYRATHRASSSRGCIGWDMSYMSTIGCQGSDETLESMLKALSFHGEGWSGRKHAKWTAGMRFSEGWVHERENPKRPITPIAVLWQTWLPQSSIDSNSVPGAATPATRIGKRIKLNRRLWIRVHPSVFHQFWLELLKVAKMQNPQVLVEDLRFEVGSIQLTGPGSSEAVAGVLKLVNPQSDLRDIWSVLPLLNSPAALPKGATLAVDALDPRCFHPPPQVRFERSDEAHNRVNELIIEWPTDQQSISSRLFSQKERYRTSKSIPSQRSINRRKAGTLPGQDMSVLKDDPAIPVILLAHRSSELASVGAGSWTLLMPWSCVDLIWRSLMYYPLTTGSTPRFGGLQQTQQLAFEQAIPWFPGDFPATQAGQSWERTQSEQRFDTWMRRPASKRLAWQFLDLGLGRKGEIGNGWSCDWEWLFHLTNTETSIESQVEHVATDKPQAPHRSLLTQRQRKAAAEQQQEQEQARRRNTSSPESDAEPHGNEKVSWYRHLSPTQALSMFRDYRNPVTSSEQILATVKITYMAKGTPKAPARIYRLPSDPGLRDRWIHFDTDLTNSNPASSTELPKYRPQERRNQNGDLTAHRVYDPKFFKDLSHIRVFPPNETKPQVLNMFGAPPPMKTAQDVLKALQPQLFPKMIVNAAGDVVEESLWDKHVPCPDPQDLIGFVTSGGYSLSLGRGTAIGSIWAQRVLQGWKTEEDANTKTIGSDITNNIINNGAKDKSHIRLQQSKKMLSKEDTEKAKKQKRQTHQIERHRHLCIIRNSGESIGRLAMWELC